MKAIVLLIIGSAGILLFAGLGSCSECIQCKKEGELTCRFCRNGYTEKEFDRLIEEKRIDSFHCKENNSIF